MKFDNKIGNLFNNISQRVIYPYIITYPDFIPIENNSVSREAQRQMHEFMKETLLTVYNNPEIIGMSTEKDDYFDWEAFKDKPDLNNFMKKLEKKFLGFFALLYEIGINGEISNGELFINKSKKALNKGKILQLSEIGLICTNNGDGVYIHSSDYPELSTGWKLLSNICMESENKKKDAVISQSITRLLFKKCIFSKDHVSFTRLYGDLPQSGKYLEELESFFQK